MAMAAQATLLANGQVLATDLTTSVQAPALARPRTDRFPVV
jgi:hypothetical protein